jgi:hypothetical protein
MLLARCLNIISAIVTLLINGAAAKNRGFIEKDMTSNQIAQAQKLSKEYYAKYVM